MNQFSALWATTRKIDPRCRPQRGVVSKLEAQSHVNYFFPVTGSYMICLSFEIIKGRVQRDFLFYFLTYIERTRSQYELVLYEEKFKGPLDFS